MANIITSQTAAANSADFTLADGASAVVQLIGDDSTGALGPANIVTLGSDTRYSFVAQLPVHATGAVALRVHGPATYRVEKPATTIATGVDKT